MGERPVKLLEIGNCILYKEAYCFKLVILQENNKKREIYPSTLGGAVESILENLFIKNVREKRNYKATLQEFIQIWNETVKQIQDFFTPDLIKRLKEVQSFVE